MKKTVAVMMLLAGGLFAAPRVTVGIGFGVPAPVAVVRVVPRYEHARVFVDHRFEHFRR
jgi:hypothetical protein